MKKTLYTKSDFLAALRHDKDRGFSDDSTRSAAYGLIENGVCVLAFHSKREALSTFSNVYSLNTLPNKPRLCAVVDEHGVVYGVGKTERSAWRDALRYADDHRNLTVCDASSSAVSLVKKDGYTPDVEVVTYRGVSKLLTSQEVEQAGKSGDLFY